MGFQDRDYMQGGNKPPIHFRLPKLEPIWWFLIAILFCSLLKIDATPLFQVSFESLKNGSVWTLFFSLFAVGSKGLGGSHQFFFPLLWQGIVLYFFGRRIIEIYGFKNFLLTYCLGAYAALSGYLLCMFLNGANASISMTEIVLAQMGANTILMMYAFRYPKEVILLFFVLPIQIRFLAGLIFLMELGTIVSNSAQVTTGVIALSVGAVFSMSTGLLLGWKFLSLEKIKRFFKGIFSSEVKLPGGLSFDEASTDQIKSEVDRLLGKVSDDGITSLTEKEKAFLKKSSNRY
ncbi:MAG: hypothetical protein COA79_18310 [Planctomycetota bacterium]|nr:MAG: hypothetical protein COA79_18310 [Planctomycetota bacterium]